MKKILITGAAGFIGSHLTEYLLRKKFKITVFDRYNPFGSFGWLDTIDTSKKVNFILGDIRDFDSVNNAIKGQDIVIHLAALIGIPYSYVSPSGYIKTNIEGTYNVLESSRKNNLSQVIITSTSETYGTAKSNTISENHQLNAQSPYAASKIAADHLALSYFNSFNLPVKIIRPFNTYGPRQSLRAIIPTIICQALKSSRIELGNLNTSRDLTFIKDTCEAFYRIMNSNKAIGEVINVGSNNNFTIMDLVRKISKILDKKLQVKKVQKRMRPDKSEVKRLRCNNQKITKITGWKPKFSKNKDFEEGLRTTVKWFKNKHNLKFYNEKIMKIYNV